jgi:hypothetical protein
MLARMGPGPSPTVKQEVLRLHGIGGGRKPPGAGPNRRGPLDGGDPRYVTLTLVRSGGDNLPGSIPGVVTKGTQQSSILA